MYKREEIYELVRDFPAQVENAYKLKVPKLKNNFNRILIFGMGGSYIGGLVFKEIIKDELKIPIQVCNSFEQVDDKTMIILSSYSGNTKEVLQAFRNFPKKNMLVISSGGKLITNAKRTGVPFIQIKPSLHQRFTISYGIIPLVKCFEHNEFIKRKKVMLGRIIEILKRNKNKIEQEAKVLARKMNNKLPLFYSSSSFDCLSYRFQTSLEEDVKEVCHSNKISELFHNELEIFGKSKKGYFTFLITDSKDLAGFEKQFLYFKSLLNKGNFYEFKFNNYNKSERIFLGIYFVDFLGFYLSKLKATKMGETPLSDKIKKK
jgi:glucose/mannose-6-phosphate isomerase